jgi:hypothetical protein
VQKSLGVTLIALGISCTPCARANDVQNLFRALGKAVQEQAQQQQGGKNNSPPSAPADGIPPTGAGFNRVGRNVDTPENLALLKSRVAARIDAADPSSTGDLALMHMCKEEMAPLAAFERVIGTGYDELRAKCEVEAREPMNRFHDRQATNARQRRDAQAAAAARQQAEKSEQEERERLEVMTELRSGKRKPVTCQQWIAANGQDPKDLNAQVMQIAYEAPKGVGYFMGRVEQINGDTMLLADQPIIRMRGAPQGYMVVSVAAAKIFGGSEIKLGTVVDGFANQTGKRTMKMTDGSGQQAPVLVATCMNALM